MTKQSVIVFLGLTMLVNLGAAQPLPVRIYGGTQDERAYALVEAVDSGYCLAGWTKSYGPGTPAYSNLLVINTDPQGRPNWARISTGLKDDEAYSMVKAHDNCYVLCGMTRSYSLGTTAANIFVIKLDRYGNQLWGWVYGGNNDDIAQSIIQTSDRGFALCGFTRSFGPQPYPNAFIMKLDSLGRMMWLRVYWMFPNHMEDEAYSIVQTSDYGFAVGGRAKATAPNLFDAFLLKTDAIGNPNWLWIVPGDSNDEAHSVAFEPYTRDILVAGWTNSFLAQPNDPANLFVARLNLTGNLLWSFHYGWPNGAEKVLDDRSLVTTPDSGCIVCGPTTSVGPGVPTPNFLILKLDWAGNITWARSHPSAYDPGLLNDVPFPMTVNQWRGYAVAGFTNSYPQRIPGENFILSTFDQQGNRPFCAEPQTPDTTSFPWLQWEISDSLYRPEMDTIPTTPVEVQYDSICYDTSGQGLYQGNFPYQPRAPELRILSVSDKIQLELNQSDMVELSLWSADGRKVNDIFTGRLTPGRHTLGLTKNSPAGVYLIRAKLTNRTLSAKLLRY